MKPTSNIPSDEDFARAEQKMKDRLMSENNFKNKILSSLSNKLPCHDIWVWSGKDKTTVSYVFPSDADLNKKYNSEIELAIKSTAQAMGIENVTVEYHSHEYVLKRHNGNYDKYFR